MKSISRHIPISIHVLAIAILCTACGPNHIRPFTARQRHYEPGAFEAAPKRVSDGSIWQDSSRSLMADFRASRVGDLVTIKVDETPKASGDATTELSRDSSMSLGANNLLGLTHAITEAYPNVDPKSLIDLMSKTDFNGTGKTERNSRVQASMAARVKQSLPNGDLFIEGTKVIMVNDEELHIYVSGVIRPEDIEQNNTVSSSLIADAQIEFTGRGDLTDNQRQGWLTRLLSAINPF
jgi:flagellar L-ring protein precursor FlgH